MPIPSEPAAPFEGIPWGDAAQPAGDLTERQRDALRSYTISADRLNEAMRSGTGLSDRLQTQAVQIRSALVSSDTAFRVTRAMLARHLGLTSPADAPDLVDELIVDDAFLSTCGDATPPRTKVTSSSVILELLVSPGVGFRGVQQLSEFPLEHEIIVIDAVPIYIVDAKPEPGINTVWRLFGVAQKGDHDEVE